MKNIKCIALPHLTVKTVPWTSLNMFTFCKNNLLTSGLPDLKEHPNLEGKQSAPVSVLIYKIRKLYPRARPSVLPPFVNKVLLGHSPSHFSHLLQRQS